jgi:3-hydroxy-3-methylglutaryl CoA synthase
VLHDTAFQRPFLCAGIVKTALNLRDDVVTEDFTSSLKCGTSALITAL